jgi:hypothetical protein
MQTTSEETETGSTLKSISEIGTSESHNRAHVYADDDRVETRTKVGIATRMWIEPAKWGAVLVACSQSAEVSDAAPSLTARLTAFRAAVRDG